MKCLPHNKLPLAQGNVLHDWHAEVLAIRAFNRFLLDQCLSISLPPYPRSEWVRKRFEAEYIEHENQTFAIRDDVRIYMYCSEAPCGDASMELIMDAQEDATPWTRPPPTVSDASPDDASLPIEQTALRGRSNFSHLGAVRCKPSRPDAPPTMSKSCTDKLALAQATSLLSSVTSLLIHPRNAYIDTLILPSSQHVPIACSRAFSSSGRFKGVTDKRWKAGYQWKPFNVQGTNREFAWSRRSVPTGQKAMPSNMSAVYTPAWQETLIGGVLQGRKQFDPRGASAICRRSVWITAARLACVMEVPPAAFVSGRRTYRGVKDAEELLARRQVKENVKDTALRGWVTNTGDDGFELDEGNGVS